MNWFKSNRQSVKDPLDSEHQELISYSSVDKKKRGSKRLEYSTPSKIKSNPSLSLEKVNTRTIDASKNSLSTVIKRK